MKNIVKRGSDCPYLDTINRNVLDFDFDKFCSISLSQINIYACLICGKFFQGRGKNTCAFFHSLEVSHHIFMHLDNGSVWCLPEGYKLEDRSLDDIRSYLNPTFTKQDIERLDKSILWARALDGTEYIPGLVGLNNLKANDYINVVLQILARVRPTRDFFLNQENYAHIMSPLLQKVGELLRKMWYPNQFKGQVSPHEFLQTVARESNKRFSFKKQCNPLHFLEWIMMSLHSVLMSFSGRKKTIVSESFFGELEIWTEQKAQTDFESLKNCWGRVERKPFLYLSLDPPQVPMFKNAFSVVQLPQVPLFQLLEKYNGFNTLDNSKPGRRYHRLSSLPRFLIIMIHRFNKNAFFIEKNQTIVTVPDKPFILAEAIPVPNHCTNNAYNLIASLTHTGNVTSGSYKVFIKRAAERQWYEIQDLSIKEVLPQTVILSETYLQVFERDVNYLNLY